MIVKIVIPNIVIFIEVCFRILLGILLIYSPNLPINKMLNENHYCDQPIISQAEEIFHSSPILSSNPIQNICGLLIYFIRAFGCFNIAFGLFIELGRRFAIFIYFIYFYFYLFLFFYYFLFLFYLFYLFI